MEMDAPLKSRHCCRVAHEQFLGTESQMAGHGICLVPAAVAATTMGLTQAVGPRRVGPESRGLWGRVL